MSLVQCEHKSDIFTRQYVLPLHEQGIILARKGWIWIYLILYFPFGWLTNANSPTTFSIAPHIRISKRPGRKSMPLNLPTVCSNSGVALLKPICAIITSIDDDRIKRLLGDAPKAKRLSPSKRYRTTSVASSNPAFRQLWRHDA